MSTPYLPGRVVYGLASQKRRWQLFWGVYVALCVVLAFRLTGTVRWGFVVLVWVPTVHSWLVKRAIKQYGRDSALAVAALHRNEPELAEGHLVALRERYRWPRALRNLSSYNLALALYRQGRLVEAIEMLADADRHGGSVETDPTLASSLALFHALCGDLKLADAWLVEAQRRYAGRMTANRFPNLQAELAVALRRGKFADVKARLDRDWVEIESSSKGESMRPLRLFRAFAAARAPGGPDAAVVGPLLAALHPARAADFDYMTKAWPELQAFLAANLPA